MRKNVCFVSVSIKSLNRWWELFQIPTRTAEIHVLLAHRFCVIFVTCPILEMSRGSTQMGGNFIGL
jgi:hypothetical protein